MFYHSVVKNKINEVEKLNVAVSLGSLMVKHYIVRVVTVTTATENCTEQKAKTK